MGKSTDNMKVIFGKVPSKSNGYKIACRNGIAMMYKSAALKQYEKDFYMQIGSLRDSMIEGYIKVKIDVYYPSNRSDLDGSQKVFFDCLQTARVIKNDNKVVEILARKFVDKVNPRIEFEIKEVEM